MFSLQGTLESESVGGVLQILMQMILEPDAAFVPTVPIEDAKVEYLRVTSCAICTFALDRFVRASVHDTHWRLLGEGR